MPVYIVTLDGEEFRVDVREDGGAFALQCDGRLHTAALRPVAGGPLHALQMDTAAHDVLLEPEARSLRVTLDGTVFHAVVQTDWQKRMAEMAPKSRRRAADVIRGEMPGIVVKVMVAEGQAVKQGDGLLILEAMKMENQIKAPHDGVVKSIAVAAGRQVSVGEALLTLDFPPETA